MERYSSTQVLAFLIGVVTAGGVQGESGRGGTDVHGNALLAGGLSTGNETGLNLCYSIVLNGDFVVCGSNTRRFYGHPLPEWAPPAQVDPFIITLSGVPAGSEVVRAFAHWSYLANEPYPETLAEITVNGTPVIGTLVGEAQDTLCWQDYSSRTVGYAADITELVTGNGNYLIGGAVDPEVYPPPWLGEGVTLLVIYRNASQTFKQINVYSGMTTTQTGPSVAEAGATLEFCPEPYMGGPAHFFMNALDGQGLWPGAERDDSFYLNDIYPGSVLSELGTVFDSWQGFLGQGSRDSMYDHAEGEDISSLMSVGAPSISFRTVYYGDCIGHSLAAIAFVTAGAIDTDGDKIPDACDNCPESPNLDQADHDKDGIGDVCDNCPCDPTNTCTSAAFWADSDSDCDVDETDFSTIQRCFYGLGIPHSAACEVYDRDCDGDVDSDDLAKFITVALGPEVRANPSCPAPPLPDPPDGDSDNIPDGIDNCIAVANTEQLDADADGVGDACDNCPAVPNADQANMDGDLAGDVCDEDRDGDGLNNDVDPCPDSSITSDQDEDGIHDLCDPDLDGDGILEDGDGNGVAWDNPCVGGATTGCDDNCGLDVNPDQLDWDADGVGNACDPEPGLPPEELGGELAFIVADPLAVNWMNDAETRPPSGGLSRGDAETNTEEDAGRMPASQQNAGGTPAPQESAGGMPASQSGAMAYFVTHNGTGTSVDLPAGGGTVVVDVVVATAGPLDVWEVTPTMSAANVVSVDAAGWSSRAELLAWAGLSSDVPASRYNCGELYWIIANAQGSAVCQAWAGTVCADRLLNAGTTAFTGTYDLDALSGPMSVPAGTVFTSASPIGAIVSRTISGGKAVRVATLTLNVAGVPGTYSLTLTNGSWYSAAAGEQAAMSAGPGFEIRVGE